MLALRDNSSRLWALLKNNKKSGVRFGLACPGGGGGEKRDHGRGVRLNAVIMRVVSVTTAAL